MQTSILEFYGEYSCIWCDFIGDQEQEAEKRKKNYNLCFEGTSGTF